MFFFSNNQCLTLLLVLFGLSDKKDDACEVWLNWTQVTFLYNFAPLDQQKLNASESCGKPITIWGHYVAAFSFTYKKL